ncbi:MAG: peptidase S41, partial [Muribaculaceae bacterium]|nr:peptidase S41 [Muribaculaceae bacterium]
MKKTIVASLAFAAALGVSAETPLWLRNVKISPDGENIAFTYQGDIYTVNAAGGKAKRITTSTAYDTNPIWSPDSKKILFSSDRHGNFDLYIVPAEGGEAVRLTTNSASEIPEAFSTDGKRVYYSAYIQAPTKSVLFPSARLTQLYSIPVGGGTPRQELGTPVRSISWLPDGKSFLYQDVKGMENEWRKHHTSSVSKDIWKYDATTGKHQNLTDRPGEDRNPILSKDGKTVYFLSERNGGSFNVYQAPVGDMKNAKALTNYKTHPIRFLSQADNGLLAFGYDGEIYTMMPGGRPNKVEIDVLVDPLPVKTRTSVSGSYGVPSPDGKQVAYTARGEVFVTSTEHSSTKQITHTPAAEKHVSWNPDNREIVYTSLRDGHFNIYSAKIASEDDPNFSNATIIEEKPIIKVDNVERTMPKYSPDGKKIAFIQDRNKLMVFEVDSKKTRQLTDGSNYT